MKRPHEIERMAPMQRRRFLKLLSGALAAPFVPSAVRFAANEIAGGVAHAAEMDEGRRYLVEINLRDQWDQGHVMVAPGLATYSGLSKRAEGNHAALYFGDTELVHSAVNGTDVYLTADSSSLQPHLGDIAMIDCCELNEGEIHGHEAANPVRTPGRSYQQTGGKMPLFENDPVTNFPHGNERFYSTTPTPATLVNHVERQKDPDLKSGAALKGISRSAHTAYHFAGSLGSASELRRHYTAATLFGQFPAQADDYNVLPSRAEADAVASVLARLDMAALDRRRRDAATRDAHGQVLSEVPGELFQGDPKTVSLPLSAEEIAYWSAGVPEQVTGRALSDEAKDGLLELWEQMAWTTKLIKRDLVGAMALEFDYVDHHGPRGEGLIRTMAKQLALPLTKMIQELKDAGKWQQTTIAIYTTDGSRQVAADSYGLGGKNTVILAGGGIRGGYFGDIQVAGGHPDGGHVYRYHAPEAGDGSPGPGSTESDRRLAAAPVWRTVARAAGVSDSQCDQFSDVAGVAPLSFLLK